MSDTPKPGAKFEIAYPFVRDTYSAYDEEGGFERETWRPGVRFEAISPEDTGSVADGLGFAVFTVVASFKPGRFPTRVFFTRSFTDPDGRTFGKSKLHIVTLDKFRRLTRGYQHPFGIGRPLENSWNAKAAELEFVAMLSEYVASADTRRMAETPLGGSGRSPSGAVPKADAHA